MEINVVYGNIEDFGDFNFVVDNHNQPSESNIHKLQPAFCFSVGNYKVLEEHPTYYVRNHDGSYREMYVYKEYDERQELDYRDEVLMHPFVRLMNDGRVSGSIVAFPEHVEEAKQRLAGEMIRRLEYEIQKCETVIQVLEDKGKWIEYNEE